MSPPDPQDLPDWQAARLRRELDRLGVLGELPARELFEAWHRAVDRWGRGVDLGLFEPLSKGDELAYIDLSTRRTRINFARLAELGEPDRYEALFAHEVGHHCRYPRTLVNNAKLIRRLRTLVTDLETTPGLPHVGEKFKAERFDFVANLATDVLINDALRDVHAADFAAIYRALVAEARTSAASPSAGFGFTLAVYEALWPLRDGPILKPAWIDRLAAISNSFRPEADDLASALRSQADNMYLCLDLFCEAAWPYLVADEQERQESLGAFEGLLAADLDGLEPGDLIQVVRRSRAEQEADEAQADRRHPVLVELPPDDPDSAQTPPDSDVLAEMLKAGTEFGNTPRAVAETVLWYYRREAERLAIELERDPRTAPLIPTGLAGWEPGDDVDALDWVATLGRAGVAVPGLTLLQREFEVEQVGQGKPVAPWLEIYVDSSYSMPDPSQAFSDLAFAGFLLVRAALAAGSKVRIVQFSGPENVIAMPDFTAEENSACLALLEYLGGGTLFPFDVLTDSLVRLRSTTRVERVLLSDLDFFHNVSNAKPRSSALAPLTEAARPPDRFTAVLNTRGVRGPQLAELMPSGLAATNIRILAIEDWKDLHGVAARLGREIFDR